ncbi:MAG: hypothetical protein WC117_01095 [Sphaerochaetaceae bacterium]
MTGDIPTPIPFVIRGLRDISCFLHRSKNEAARLIREEGLPVSMENNAYISTSRLLLEWQEDRCVTSGVASDHSG